MEIIPFLKKVGLSEKEIKVYLSLLEGGPSSVRILAQKSGINRGSVYDSLKVLKALGLVSYYHKDTKQFFVTEDPMVLTDVVEERRQSINQIEQNIKEIIPTLQSLYHSREEKPLVKYYEGNQGVKTILKDVLTVVRQAKNKTYQIFSSSAIRPYLHRAWPQFTAQRIKEEIRVEVIAVGHSGTPAKLSERKSLSTKEGPPTYILIYSGKVAMISVNEQKKPLGLIIEDKAIFQTQLQLFKFIWQSL